MSELHKALADIGSIRLQLAQGTLFRGFGPTVVALTGLMALALAAGQAAWFDGPWSANAFFGAWVLAAVVSAGLVALEMIARTRRQHSGLADALLFNAIMNFVPAAAAGAVIGGIVLYVAPDAEWMLPGLCAMLVSIALFAAMRFLPRTVAIAGVWYFVAGAVVLFIASDTRTLSPWAMGLPFGIGQLLIAAILRVALGDGDVETI